MVGAFEDTISKIVALADRMAAIAAANADGDLLHALGYGGVVGLDMSEPMMERAARLGAYAELVRGVLGDPLAFPDGRFAAVMTVRPSPEPRSMT